ncbi:WD40-repeat-containing domain protein [Crucibulum laeve]|uniref:WD40-repeat-containing domain protein n=1 Tax=Crucibulum laeve TaxID=68775 RepID=A0A5C3LE05_9AGAR|nr:WD40-repeat-containing domain protein [Crucibulum laeve]
MELGTDNHLETSCRSHNKTLYLATTNSQSNDIRANGGVIRKGGVESKLDVVTRDYVPPPRADIKGSKSQPAVNRSGADIRDRFITNRETTDIGAIAASIDKLSLNPESSPGHTARLAAATGAPIHSHILGYHEQPPSASSSDTTLAQQREFAKPLYAQRPPVPLPTNLASSPPSWTACLMLLGCVDFSNDGAYLGVGIGNGDVELWDAESGQKLRTMTGHQLQVAALSWHQHILTSGCNDGSIWHHDVRMPRHKVMGLLGHMGEVCGLKWRSDGELLASGGNGNVVNVDEPHRALYTKTHR